MVYDGLCQFMPPISDFEDSLMMVFASRPKAKFPDHHARGLHWLGDGHHASEGSRDFVEGRHFPVGCAARTSAVQSQKHLLHML